MPPPAAPLFQPPLRLFQLPLFQPALFQPPLRLFQPPLFQPALFQPPLFQPPLRLFQLPLFQPALFQPPLFQPPLFRPPLLLLLSHGQQPPPLSQLPVLLCRHRARLLAGARRGRRETKQQVAVPQTQACHGYCVETAFLRKWFESGCLGEVPVLTAACILHPRRRAAEATRIHAQAPSLVNGVAKMPVLAPPLRQR